MRATIQPKSQISPQPTWQETVSRYQNPDPLRSWWQVINTVVPYFILWAIMIYSLEISYWLTLLLTIPAASFLIRTFIIFHDCGHGSFFKSKRANNTLGVITGFMTFTPYFRWRHHHAIHHATAGDLDRRGTGDIYTMTVEEYQALPLRKRFLYQLSRNPKLMFTVGSTAVFLIAHRFSHGATGKRERYSVYWTNLAILLIFILAALTIGWKAYLLIQLPIIILASTVGVWLFYVQHQFEDTYWERHKDWNYESAALEGSSYYKLPRLLQWITGNIGFHHIHHLSPRIPNYNLEKCYKENPIFQAVEPLTILGSLRCLSMRLWDEDKRLMVGFDSDITFINLT
ncbi:MAG TPA: fatty acid desaturase [Anaerolineales bacterium]|nr:fatty acid desaturase [Anaerolineales bacterium]